MRESECIYFRIHFHVQLNKGRLASFRKRLATEEFEKAFKKFNSRMVSVVVKFPTDSRYFVATFSVKSMTTKGLGQGTMRQFYRLIQLFVDRSERLGCSKAEVYSDVMFAFPKSQRFLSLPRLPGTMISDPNSQNLGIGQLFLVGLTFRKSRLGLTRAILSYQNHKQTLEIASKMKVTNMSKLPERIYSKSEGIASLFLV